MGIQRENGYSATISAYFADGGVKYVLARTNGVTFDFTEPQELSPGTEGDLVVTLDGTTYSRRVILPDGASLADTTVRYDVIVPF